MAIVVFIQVAIILQKTEPNQRVLQNRAAIMNTQLGKIRYLRGPIKLDAVELTLKQQT